MLAPLFHHSNIILFQSSGPSCAIRFTLRPLAWATPFAPVSVLSRSCFPAFLIETKGLQIFSLISPVGMMFEIVRIKVVFTARFTNKQIKGGGKS